MSQKQSGLTVHTEGSPWRLLLLFSQVLAKKNYNLSVSRGHAAFRPNLEKTVIYLLQYCETAPHEPGSRYVVQKTRSEISSEAFFSPKTLERCLYRLREAGMLSIARGKICISEEQWRTRQLLWKPWAWTQ